MWAPAWQCALPGSSRLPTQNTSNPICFGEFTLDLRTGELRRNGTTLKLQPQPARLLTILVSRAGEVVTRQELSDQVWGSDTYVDFEHGLNYAVQQIRSALEDDPKEPRFLETLPKRGYRFTAPLVDQPMPDRVPPAMVESGPVQGSRTPRRRFVYLAGAAVLGLVFTAVWLYVRTRGLSSAPGRLIQSIAVLPLRNLSNDAEQEYFSDGMTDELITDLAKASSLRVISHTSVERFKRTKMPLPEIARQLGVDAIVEGTVMRSADRVRITAQLIDARSDQHLWADSYERDLRNIFELQEEVAGRIAGEIGTSLIAEGQQPPTRVHEVDPGVYESYL